MQKLLLAILLFVLTNQVFAQIDTTVWYPLQIGNLWQYSYDISISETYYLNAEVVTDTIIIGKKFFKMKVGNGFVFQRLENNERVWEYNTYTDQEFVRYDFISSDKTVWHLDSSNEQYGIYETFPQYIQIFGDTLISKIFVSAYIDTSNNPPDTSWGPVVDGLANIVTKGLGVTEYGGGFNICRFEGAIINGQEIGHITSVKENLGQTILFKLNQNYPNPFNPSTTIKYTIPSVQTPLLRGVGGVLITLKVYDILGKRASPTRFVSTLKASQSIPPEIVAPLTGIPSLVSIVTVNGSELLTGLFSVQAKLPNRLRKIKIVVFIQTPKSYLS